MRRAGDSPEFPSLSQEKEENIGEITTNNVNCRAFCGWNKDTTINLINNQIQTEEENNDNNKTTDG